MNKKKKEDCLERFVDNIKLSCEETKECKDYCQEKFFLAGISTLINSFDGEVSVQTFIGIFETMKHILLQDRLTLETD